MDATTDSSKDLIAKIHMYRLTRMILRYRRDNQDQPRRPTSRHGQTDPHNNVDLYNVRPPTPTTSKSISISNINRYFYFGLKIF